MKRHKLIYVLAASHSGSTLTAMLLGAHPNTCTVGELKLNSLGDAQQYVCSCREPILHCEFWARVKSKMSKFGESFDLSDPEMDYFSGDNRWIRTLERPLYRGGILEFIRQSLLRMSREWRRHIATVQRRNAKFVESVLDVAGARVIVDSSKIGSRLGHLLKNPTLDVFVVRVIRDGRAVALTYMDPAKYADASRPEFKGGGVGLSRENEMLSMKSAAHEWLRSNEEAEAILREVHGENQVEIRYEELCANPVQVLNRVFEKLGLQPLDRIPAFRTANRHVVGNGMRMDSSEMIRLDERWRARLNEAELDVFDSIAGDLNGRLGYD